MLYYDMVKTNFVSGKLFAALLMLFLFNLEFSCFDNNNETQWERAKTLHKL